MPEKDVDHGNFIDHYFICTDNICLQYFRKIKKKNSFKKNTQITNLNQENSLLKVEISKLHLDKVTLSKKIAELLQHNDALRKYQDIIDVKVECDYLLKKLERDSLRLKEKSWAGVFTEAQS